MLPTIIKPTRVTHTSATLINNLYVKTNKLDQLNSGIITLDISDHVANFPIFVLLVSRKPKKGQPVVVEYRKLNDAALSNMKSMLMVTDCDYLEQLDIENQSNSLVAKIHEYMDICAPVKTAKIPYKFATRNKWMTKGLLRSSRQLCKLRMFVCWSLTSLCHSNGHIETMPAREINPFTALTRIRSRFLRTQ